jgi:hypothetical protein
MATLAELEAAIEELMAHPLGPGQYALVRAVEEKAYEAYVFGLCLRAARSLGAQVVLYGISGMPTPFVFRGAPGQIHSRHRNYGYAAFSLNGQEFEVHAGVEFVGTSGMKHEMDVCIMRASDARQCRAEPQDPGSASVVAAWECKFYDGPLDKHLARAFVGLVDDFGSNVRLTGLCSNRSHNQIKDYLAPGRRPDPHLSMTPLDPRSEDRFVNHLAHCLKKLTRA